MKKHYNLLTRARLVFGCLVVTTMLSTQVNAQAINEQFNNVTTLWPAGWAQQNLSTTIGTVPTWFQGNTTVFPAFSSPDTSYIGANYNSTTGTGTISNWLFAPERMMNNGDVFTFYTRTVDAPAYADRLEFRLSLNGPSVNAGATPTAVGDFTTTLLTVNSGLTLAGYPSIWTQYTATISGLAGPTSGRVAFRYFVTNGGPTGSSSDFIGIDNFVYTPVGGGAPDAAITVNPGQYTIIPLSQATSIGTTGLISNVGTATMTNAVMTVNVYDGTMTSVYTATSATIPSIGMGANATATVPGFIPTLADVYTVEQIVSITEVDGTPANNTSSYQITISDSTYARDNGTVTGSLGIGGSTTGTLGQQFTINATTDLTSISFYIVNSSNSMTNQSAVMSVYSMNASGPVAILAQTTPLTIVDLVDSLYTMPISTGPLNLVPGNYMVAIEEGDSNVVIGTCTAIFTPLTTWVTFPGAPILPWAHNEDYGFPVSYLIRPNFGVPPACPNSGASVTATTCTSYTAPSGAVFSSTGTYTDIIPNACGSDSVITINLTVPVLNLTTSTAGGTITSAATGSTYQWIDCVTDMAISGATDSSYTSGVDGSYAVIVTENGCSDTSACATVLYWGLNELSENGGLEIYPNPSNGDFVVNVNGLTANTVNVDLLDLSGRVIESRTYNNVQGQLNAAMNVKVEAGSYLVRITANGESIVKTVAISK